MRNPAPRDSRMPEKASSAGFASLGGRSPDPGSQGEAVLATLLESVECGILLFGTGGELWALNNRFAQMFGVEAERLREAGNLEQLVEKVAPQFADSDDGAARWRQRFRTGEAFCDELELARPEKKIVERSARPVLDRYKQPLAWLEVHRDITSRRQIESRLFHSERLAALGQMVSGIAHELNNALTSIFGYAQLVRKRTRNFEWEMETRYILEEGDRARRIARNLLLFARGSEGERTRVNLNEIVNRMVEMRGHELRLGNISIELELDEHLAETIADAAQVQQALLNLVLNAEQAILQAKDGGHIWIRTRSISAGRIALEVADDGPGVSPEMKLRIFDPFFTTKPAGVGTGLGLSILYGIVHQHGGEVSVENRPGGGAVFTVELPSATHTSVSDPTKPYLIGASTSGDVAHKTKTRGSRILVVEDEPTIARLIADILSEEGHLVDTVLDSREGLELAVSHPYDLVVCDLRMPHLDGRAFYRQLANSENHLQHRLIFVTGDTLAPRTVDFLRKCGLPYIAKPFLIEELKQVVTHSLDKKSGILPDSPNDLEPGAPRGREHRRRNWKRYDA
jgi:PAS domain S-box-containing protein